MKEQIVEIIKYNLNPNNLHSSTIRKFYEEFPQVKEYAIKEVEKTPEIKTIGYFAIMVVKNLELKKCPNCGNLIDYESTYKNNKIFCCRKCFNDYKMKKNGTFYKPQRKHIAASLPNYTDVIKFEKINEEILYELYKNKSSREIIHLYRKSEQIREIANKKFNENKNYLTPGNALISICHGLKLPKCRYCGKEMKYQTNKNKHSLYCSVECGRKGDTYVERQQRSKYDIFYNNTVKFAKEKNCELLTPKNEYKGTLGSNKFKCLDCDKEFIIDFSYNLKRDLKCPYCSSQSSFEQDLKKFIIDNDVEIKTNIKTLLKDNYEIDIVIPHKKLCIECNGIYWHSSAMGKDKNYHLSKTNQCNKKGYELMHIFEDEWIYRRKAVKGIIKDLLNNNSITISYDQCSIKKIGLNKAEKFIKRYSLLLDYRNKSNFGIFYKNRLVGVVVTKSNTILNICKIYNLKIEGIENLVKNNFKEYVIIFDRRFPIQFPLKTIKLLPPHKFYINGSRRFINKPERKTTYEIYDCGYLLSQL